MYFIPTKLLCVRDFKITQNNEYKKFIYTNVYVFRTFNPNMSVNKYHGPRSIRKLQA